jgi:hypothetical protein
LRSKKALISFFLPLYIFSLLSLTAFSFPFEEVDLPQKMQDVLHEMDVQPADRAQIARRFGLINEEVNSQPLPPKWQTGMERSFWVINTDTNETLATRAAIVYVGEHIICWVENDSAALLKEDFYDELMKFDFEIYPFEHAIFGSEFSPGIDNDPYIHVLITGKTGSDILGYFSSRDEDSSQISRHSNAMELFILSTSLLKGDITHISNTLAHEFQHMIHFANDQNEGSIVDEGLSGLAEYLIGNRSSTIYEQMYLSDPDKSMTIWPVYKSSLPYYGGSFLFFKYIVDRMGTGIIRKIVQQPENGLDGIDAALDAYPGNNGHITADEIFAEWITANLFIAMNQPDGKYHYVDYQPPFGSGTNMIEPLGCDNTVIKSTVMQYGVDYYRLDCPAGIYQVKVTGNEYVPLIGQDSIEGNYSWWTNAENNSETSLQRDFDFSEIKDEPIILEYDIYFDLEDQYDFLYLSYSDDGGCSWKNLKTESGTDKNDSGFNLGWGYTGSSNGILHQIIDLSGFAGKKISLRFDYITDQALVTDGALIDNIHIDAVGFWDDAETDDSGWKSTGFLRLYHLIPQKFVNIFVENTGETSNPEIRWPEAGESTTFLCDFSDDTIQDCTIGISALNRYAAQDAEYSLEVIRK